MKQRLEEIDFLRCVLILLMITFHIVYIGDTYAFAKQFVYTFHMPAFLLVSGYLCNTDKKMATFMKSMMWIFITYLVMETAYVVMASLLPIREHIDNLRQCCFSTKFSCIRSALIGICIHGYCVLWYVILPCD